MLKEQWEALKKHRWLLLRIGLCVVILGLAYAVLFADETSEDALALAVLFVIAMLALILTRADLDEAVSRFSKFSLGPLSLEAVAKTALEASLSLDDEVESKGEKAETVLELREKLEQQLTYVAKHILDVDGVPSFATVGSLKYDKLIDSTQALIATNLMTLRDDELDQAPKASKDRFIRDADYFVSRFRATVLNSYVENWFTMEKKKTDKTPWEVEPIHRGPGLRPELFVRKPGEEEGYRLAAIVSDREDSDLLKKVKERLDPAKERRNDVKKRVVVIPQVSPHEEELDDADPWVVKHHDLQAVFGD